MKLFKLLCSFTLVILISTLSPAQNIAAVNENGNATETISTVKKKQLNFFIISKRQKGKFDLATRYNIFRAKFQSIYRHRMFVSIVAQNAAQVSDEILNHLNNKNARIGTIWFDSHGKYIKGYSLFLIGKDEISYKVLKDSIISSPFNRIAAFTDDETKLVIGSCYSGATYWRSSIDYKDTTRMNGDSLMFQLGKIFSHATIYGSESWVMSKPGLFHQHAAVSGHLTRNLFHDICYKPAWENLGKWNEYNAATKKFTAVNPVTLDTYGNLKIRARAYTGHDNVNKDIAKNLRKLKPGLYR